MPKPGRSSASTVKWRTKKARNVIISKSLNNKTFLSISCCPWVENYNSMKITRHGCLEGRGERVECFFFLITCQLVICCVVCWWYLLNIERLCLILSSFGIQMRSFILFLPCTFLNELSSWQAKKKQQPAQTAPQSRYNLQQVMLPELECV